MSQVYKKNLYFPFVCCHFLESSSAKTLKGKQCGDGIHLARNCSTASKVDRAFRVPKVFSSTMSRGNLQIRPLMKLIQLNIQIACVLESIAEHLPYKIAQDVLSTIAQVFNSTDLFLVDLTGLSLPVPAGIYAKVHYGTSLSNVDWLHGGAESLLTLSNLFVVLGLRQALRNEDNAKESKSKFSSETEKEKSSI